MGGSGSQLPVSPADPSLPQPGAQATQTRGRARQKRASGLDIPYGKRDPCSFPAKAARGLQPPSPPPGPRGSLPERAPTRLLPRGTRVLLWLLLRLAALRFFFSSLFAHRSMYFKSGEGKSTLSPGHFRTSKYNQCLKPGGAKATIHPGQDRPHFALR